jgi:integral membrane protein
VLTNPRRLFRLVATAEVVSWTLLIIGMVLKYVTETTELGVRVFGGIHGFVFLSYVVVTLAVWVDHRWPAKTGVLALASAVPPWMTLWFERWVERPGNGGLRETWRLGEGGEPAGSPLERVVAAAVRRPGLAVAVALVVIAVAFGVLLVIGPPVPSD